MIATLEPDVKNILSHLLLVFLLLTLNMSLTVNVPEQTSNLQKVRTEKKINNGYFSEGPGCHSNICIEIYRCLKDT